MRIGQAALLALLALVTLGVRPDGAAAQDVALDAVEEFMSEARYDSARQALELWWDERRPEAGRADRERGLWLRGLLTVDPGMAQRDFLRIVVEHRAGTYADDALVRLAHIGEASLDYEAAIRHLETLTRDHPGSPHVADARAMIERLETLPPPEPSTVATAPATPPATALDPDATRSTPDAAPPAGGGTDAPPPADTGAGGSPTDTATGAASTDAGVGTDPGAAPDDGDRSLVPAGPPVYSIQLGVFSTESRAYTLAATADALGVDVRLARLPGSEMVHVRAGSFDTRTEAEAFAREVQLTGLSAVVFDDGASEESVLPGIPD